ncbi:MAG: hypothetical protein U9N52_10405 [Campylobacterota bacterium]|nr:hypothetical protein [Campylobacterota bacterium]
MKFTLVKDLKSDTLMRPLLTGLLVFIMLFLLSDLLQKKHDIGLHVSTVNATLYGNEEEFIDSISLEVLLEIVHRDLFFMMMTLLSLSAVFGRVAPSTTLTHRTLHLLNISALLSIVFLFTAFYGGSFFVLMWLLTMWLWHLLAFGISMYSIVRLWR